MWIIYQGRQHLSGKAKRVGKREERNPETEPSGIRATELRPRKKPGQSKQSEDSRQKETGEKQKREKFR